MKTEFEFAATSEPTLTLSRGAFQGDRDGFKICIDAHPTDIRVRFKTGEHCYGPWVTMDQVRDALDVVQTLAQVRARQEESEEVPVA